MTHDLFQICQFVKSLEKMKDEQERELFLNSVATGASSLGP